jgi:hypothetical protein
MHLLALLIALLSVAHGDGGWAFEQVNSDTVNVNSDVAAQLGNDGVMHVCYLSTDSVLYHAWRDTIWHRETAVTAPASGTFRMATGRHGEVGVLTYLTGSRSIGLAEKRDTAWSIDTVLPTRNVTGFCFAYDSAGDPFLALRTGDYLLYSERHETTWTEGLIEYVPWPWGLDGPTETVVDAWNRPYICWRGYYAHAGTYGSWMIYQFRNDTGAWVRRVFLEDDVSNPILAFDARDTGQVATCYRWKDALYYNGERLDSIAPRWTRVRLDSAARPHLIMPNPRGGVIEHRYKYDGRWYRDTVMLEGEALVGNLSYTPRGELVLALIRDYRPWIARRALPQVSLDEKPSSPETGRRLTGRSPTVVGGVLYLEDVSGRQPQTACLLDAAGRKVLVIRAGANDVSGLPPGVYFVCQAADGERSTAGVYKLVVTR